MFVRIRQARGKVGTNSCSRGHGAPAAKGRYCELFVGLLLAPVAAHTQPLTQAR